MANNDDEFADLYKRYYDRLVAFLSRLGYVRSPRDLAQDVFVRVYESMSAYLHKAEWAYIEKTARRLAANEIRDSLAQKRNRKLTLALDDAGVIVDPRNSAEVNAIQQERSVLLQAAIARLPVKQREALFYQLGGFSYEEIARVLGISVEAVKSRIHEARAAVKQMMETP